VESKNEFSEIEANLAHFMSSELEVLLPGPVQAGSDQVTHLEIIASRFQHTSNAAQALNSRSDGDRSNILYAGTLIESTTLTKLIRVVLI